MSEPRSTPSKIPSVYGILALFLVIFGLVLMLIGVGMASFSPRDEWPTVCAGAIVLALGDVGLILASIEATGRQMAKLLKELLERTRPPEDN